MGGNVSAVVAVALSLEGLSFSELPQLVKIIAAAIVIRPAVMDLAKIRIAKLFPIVPTPYRSAAL
jgi:hypothetical protein